MRMRIVKVGEYQFLVCVKYGVWGSNGARFKDWNTDDLIVFSVDRSVAGIAYVANAPFVSDEVIWDNGLFAHRIPISFTQLFLRENRPSFEGKIKNALVAVWGPQYGWGIRNQQLLDSVTSQAVVEAVRARPNDLKYFVENVDRLIDRIKSKITTTALNNSH